MALQKPRAGFAKLQGENFEFFVQSYSIVLGRNSQRGTVDLDLASLPSCETDPTGSRGMNISRVHARIYFDFDARCFMLDVLGKNGVTVNGSLKAAGSPPLQLHSQDLLQIGEKKFYFLLPPKAAAVEDEFTATGEKKRSRQGSEAAAVSSKQLKVAVKGEA